ncbi:polysaccharide deacetylase family protein [Flavisphingomonas formosensis]|uniref:WalW protein n=1 Tax=Flavisphingomonas formosensis TaxID=861534 RepID=UPI001E3A8E6E|nr:WalW protein [Sphingomonas formosensis]
MMHGQNRLDRAPPPASRARLAREFGRRFAIFGDAEEEFDWSAPLSRDSTSTEAIASLPAATRRFTERGLIPTYLVDYPVVANARSGAAIAQMVADGACDVGTQLHPWVNPPFEEEVTTANSFVGNLPRQLERAKLHALTDRIEAVTGQRPIVYRAGRYGVGSNSAALLREAGYSMDVSTRALFDYSGEQGPDFSGHPIWPWWVTPGLLEVPLTTTFVGAARGWPRLHRIKPVRGLLARARLLSRVALTPEGTPLVEALVAIRRLLDDGVRLFSLSFHTPSVEIGHTPYVRDEADLSRFWEWWDGVFDLFAREGVLPARAGEIAAAAR